MKIEDYGFGKMVVDGVEYRADLIVHNDGVLPDWWRKEGHRLAVEDLRDVIERVNPEVVVVGKGRFGMMKISPEFERFLKERGVELRAANTGRAVEIFNELVKSRRVVGAFHLTC